MVSVTDICVAAVTSAFLLVIAVLCFFFPRAVQSYAMRTSGRFNPFVSWMRTSQYIWMLRMVGAMSLLAVLLILTAMLNRPH